MENHFSGASDELQQLPEESTDPVVVENGKDQLTDAREGLLDDASSDPSCKSPPQQRPCLSNFLYLIVAQIYLVLVAVVCIVAYNAIQDLLEARKRPVTSLNYRKVEQYPAPGIVVYVENADFYSCGHYYDDILKPFEVDSQTKNCTFEHVVYQDPYHQHTNRTCIVFKGPQMVKEKESLFMHFSLNISDEELFSGVEYLLFSSWQNFNISESKSEYIRKRDISKPTWTFSGGFRTWVKLSFTETTELNNTKHSNFFVEAPMVKYNDKRDPSTKPDEKAFVLFEWENEYITEATVLITRSPWNTIGVLCGVFLTLVKAAEFSKSFVGWASKAKNKKL